MPGPLTGRILALRRWAMNRRTYWSTRQTLQRVGFRIAGYRYATSAKAADLRRKGTIAWQLMKNTATIAIVATATAIVLQLIDKRAYLPAWVTAIGKNPTGYDAFLQATAAIAGVLLALSFAAISTLAGALFVRVPSNLRSLLLYEEVTAFSIQSLAFITVFSLSSLGFRGLGLAPSRFVTIGLLLALPFAIVSMTLVARRVFDLFDPSILAIALFQRLSRNARAAQAGQHRANDPNFQDHYHRQASDALDTLATMLAFAQHETELLGESLLRLAKQILLAIPPYLHAKRSIPTNSRWFARRPRYPDWYRTSSTQLDLATMTESSLVPDLQADHHWVERRLLNLSRSAYETMLKSATLEKPHRLLMLAGQTLGVLGAEWDLDLAKDYADGLTAATAASLANRLSEGTADPTPLEALVDTVTSLSTSAFLGFANSATTLDTQDLAGQIRDVRWATEVGIYALRPRLVMRRLFEDIRRTVLFERSAEGHTVTPGRVHARLLIRDLATTIQACLTLLIDWFSQSTQANARAFKATNARFGAIACINALTARWKIEQNLHRLRPLEGVLRDLEGDSATPPWPWEAWYAKLVESRAALERELASTLPGLATLPRLAEGPDLLGETVHRLGEGCFDALRNDRLESFTELFPYYFNGVFLVINQLQQQTQSTEELAPPLQDAMLDVISLSGYARVWAALHRDRRFWTVCRNQWSKYLRDPKAPGRCEAMVLMINDMRGRLAPRSTHRMRWRMTLTGVLRSLPVEEHLVTGSMIPDVVPKHPSLLIRFLGRNGADFAYDGADIFRDVYLRRDPGCRGVTFRRDSVITSLKHFARLRHR